MKYNECMSEMLIHFYFKGGEYGIRNIQALAER